MWHLFVAVALGAPAAEEVTAAFAGHPDAEVVLACAPVGSLLATAGKVPLPPALLAEADPATRSLLRLLDPSAAAEAGINKDGPLLLVGAGKELVALSVPFDGSAAQAGALLRQFDPDVREDGSFWKLSRKDQAYLGTLGEGVLRLDAVRAGVAGPALPDAAALTRGLPEVPGCVLVVRGVDTEKADGALSAFVPLGGKAPLLIRAQVDQLAAPAELARGGPVGDGAHTVEAPSMVLTVAVSIDTLLDAAAQAGAIPADSLAKVHHIVSFGAGTSVALFGNPRDRRFAAVIPISAPDGAALPPRKVVRFVTKASDGKIRRTGATTFTGTLGDETVFGAADAGRVVLGGTAELVQTVLADAGEPWLTPEMRSYTSTWPITLQSRSGSGPFALRTGLRTVGPAWEFSVEMTGGSPELTGFLMGMASAAAVPRFAEIRHKAAGARLSDEVDAIRAAELAWLTDHGTALALPAWPRPVEQLGKDAVPWTANEAWSRLGWAPEGGESRGTYWVEVTPDGEGFTVYGALDADADGVPARWKASRDQPAARETDEKVY